ncbi:hypothetical protein [Micromonospora orduensis]|uniref:hypothetical protein n=1 Tax=Micromonospora orduensis TaxID=1420891 RepID=UPI00142ECA0F|nr:hypothetical protein [Micromonospora orduensis]
MARGHDELIQGTCRLSGAVRADDCSAGAVTTDGATATLGSPARPVTGRTSSLRPDLTATRVPPRETPNA